MVGADTVDCRASNVDIIDHACVLTFGTMTTTIMSREADELYATIAEAGVRPDAAAGRSTRACLSSPAPSIPTPSSRRTAAALTANSIPEAKRDPGDHSDTTPLALRGGFPLGFLSG
jgi:hypothetical protein